MKKKFLLLFITCLLAANSFAQAGEEEIISGTCGDHLTCVFNRSTGVLTISGTGAMWDFYLNEDRVTGAPWSLHRADLKTVVMEQGITSIGLQAFNLCQSLTDVTIPNSVTSIGNSAFYGCTSLTSFVFPKSVTSIGTSVFYWCELLTEIKVENPVPPAVSNGTFNGMFISMADITLIVPAGSKAAYQAADVWKDFGTIEEYGQTEGPQDLEPFLYLEKTDGNLFEIPFTDSEIRLQDNLITANTPSAHYSFAYDEVDSFWFELKSSGGASIKNQPLPTSVQVFLDGAGILHVSGNHPLRNIAIYSITGHLMKKVDTDAAETTINISHFAKGVYLVKTYEKTVKIIK